MAGGSNVPPANSQATPDLQRVHSRLSSNPWMLNETIPTTTAYSWNNYNPERHTDDPLQWGAALVHSSDHFSTERGRTQVSDPGTARLQGFQFLRADHYSSGRVL